ncbi:MAG: PQQ-like beta-propeller repeat protein [Verrucomicrobia bacterium]|nr:PQQ-like beta-propeller repeat protein [Verrucomicrobiota bacterium]
MSDSSCPPPVRWQIGARIAVLGSVAIAWVRWHDEWPFQKRNLITYEIACVTILALTIWWLFLSRASWRFRLRIVAASLGLCVLAGTLVRLRGMSGDMTPLLEWRWSKSITSQPVTQPTAVTLAIPHADFPQFRGPDRTGVLAGPKLDSDWTRHPPQLLWRKSIGAGWSGFVVVGDLCITQAQRDESECVSAFALTTGEPRWVHRDPVRYQTLIGGEGPRATPTVSGNRVYTLGSTGLLNCLDLKTGDCVWSKDTVSAVNGRAPEWGAASSPLIVDDLVIVHGGEQGTHSLVAFRLSDGVVAWKAGPKSSYSTPIFATLAGVPQIIAMNDRSVSAHDPKTGNTLWQRPFGNGNVHCASPLVIGDDRVLISSGYGVGAELFKLTRSAEGLNVESLWQSTRMKAKFAHFYTRDGCIFGLDDGILAGADLRDGSKLWRDGRYGHGQGIVVGDYYLLMAESGDLVLLRPTREAPNELTRITVFQSKTWNPIALSGDLLIVRNDREAACLRLEIAR